MSSLSGCTTGTIFSLCYDFHLGVAISSGPCQLSAYTTGDNGNVFQVLDNYDSTRSAAYIYDPLNRIAQAYTTNETSGNCWGETYASAATAPGVLPSASNSGIDAWSNLTNRSGVSGMGGCLTEGLSTTTNTNNQLGGLAYDAAGNVTNDGNGNQPTYDAENRIATDAGVNYFYDADVFRMEKSSGTMYWPGPGGEVLSETNLNGTINEEYIYFAGRRIARVDRPSGAVHYYFSDNLGSTGLVTDDQGNVQEREYFYPFGGIVSTVGSDSNHYKFTSKERDIESNLDNFGARFFTSSLGRFMTPDWAARPTAVPYAVFGDPQSLNLYSYVRNDPVTNADADGHGVFDYIMGVDCSWGQCDKNQANKNNKSQSSNTAAKAGAQNSGCKHFCWLEVAANWLAGNGPRTNAEVLHANAENLRAYYKTHGTDLSGLTDRQVVDFEAAMQGGKSSFVSDGVRIVIQSAVFKIPVPGLSGKEGAKDVPSWARGNRPRAGQSGKDFATELMNGKYGEGNWDKSTREFSQIQKWADRNFMDPPSQ